MLYPMRSEYALSQGLVDLIYYVKEELGDTKNLRLVEIGSYAGESSVIFAKHFKEVVCIDPFLDGYDANDIASSFAPFSEVEKAFDNATKDYSNIVKIKAISDLATIYLKGKYDVVYIDGMHTYEQVKKDILNYVPFLNQKHIISGHDYSDSWIGVKQAIIDTIGFPDKTFIDTSWAIKSK